MAKGTKGGFYAVRVGRKPGIYTTWDECAAQVNGFQGAKHKKFPTEAEARAFAGLDSGAGSTSDGSASASTSRTNGTGAVTAALRQKRSSDGANLDDSPAKRSKVIGNGNAAAHPAPKASQGTKRRVYCDGSSRGNGQKGAVAGIGVFWSHEEGAPNLSERLPGKVQTNNRAEMYAVARILESDPHPELPLTICSDSQYTIDVFSKWTPGWRRKGWKNSEGKPVANQDLIRYVLSLIALRARPDSTSPSTSSAPLANITFQKVKAHVGIEGNERADQFANNGAMMPPLPEWDFERAAEDNRRKLEERNERESRRGSVPKPLEEEVEWSVELEELEEGDLLDEEELRRLSETQDF
ncbi:hypothetical protein JCM10908_004350 [Rhodotorula pacifica]|uniref:RNA-DNA hybrid ribonuclease n=1 Tax=Rhodotorula pacifica TaxID=1495444 RepID=UPI00317A5670